MSQQKVKKVPQPGTGCDIQGAIVISDGFKLSSSKKPTCANQASLGNIGAAVQEGAPDSLAVLGFFFEVIHVHLGVHLDKHLDEHFDVHLDVHLDVNLDGHLDVNLDGHLDIHLDVFDDAWLLL